VVILMAIAPVSISIKSLKVDKKNIAFTTYSNNQRYNVRKEKWEIKCKNMKIQQ
jgi:hypothetical protein